jgi:hypothetical protein
MIRTYFAFAALLVAALSAQAVFAQGKGGGQEERSRLLLIFAPGEDNKNLANEYQQLQQDTAEVNSEDVDVVYVIGDKTVKLPPPDLKTVTAESLRKRYHVDTDGFRVVLVGKDGWEKARWSTPTDPHLILARAPDMPQPKSALDQKK